MNSLNQAQIIGNVTRDVELRTTQAGQVVCTIGVATNRSWTNTAGARQEEVEFHNVVCWGKLAELADQLLRKGAKVYFAGRLQTRSWDDDSGVKHFRTEIIAEDMIVLSPKPTGNDDSARATAEPADEAADHGTEQ